MNESATQKLLEMQRKIDAMSQRERIIILLTAIVVVVMIFQFLLIDSVTMEEKQISSQLRSVQSTMNDQRASRDILQAQLTAGVNRKKLQRKDELQQQLETLDKEIKTSVIAMIPPKLMPEVLERVLSQSSGLKLISLENKPVMSVISQQEAIEGTDRQALYNHGFILTLSGNYMAAIRYFESLSELPWRFYWDDLYYEVGDYPNATITLEVHTVSMSEEWLGV